MGVAEENRMKNKINEILEFLEKNKSINRTLQKQNYFISFANFKTKEQKIISVLYDIANTQSQPKIDKLAEFFQKIIQKQACMESFDSFVKYLHGNKELELCNYYALFNAMKKQEGWGNKTAALFVKNIYNYHSDQYSSELKLWEDTPQTLNKDYIYLPVDAVIIAIFNELDKTISKRKWDFEKINKYLHTNDYSNEQIILLDDLWFWGFITQKGSQERTFEWNENKYWMLKHSDKDKKIIADIKELAEEFLRIGEFTIIKKK